METATKRAPRLVGVSGGADSVALLHLLVDSGFSKLTVCHLNHGLRGRESAADARFVAALARRLKLPCELGKVDGRRLIRESGLSLETAAREARHRFFAACAVKHRCKRVLLAHHADDQAETILWNLLRGSRGLRGMASEQRIRVEGVSLTMIRPLLGCRRDELPAWLTSNGHRWREDSSNSEAVAIRNRIRNEVFPLLESITGRDPVPPLLRAAVDSRAAAELEEELLAMAQLEDADGKIHLPSFRKLPPVLRRTILKSYLEERGVRTIDRALLERCDGIASPDAAPSVNLTDGRRLRRTAGRLWLEG
jgi:tRNA(Ile)-lysidine synthase